MGRNVDKVWPKVARMNKGCCRSMRCALPLLLLSLCLSACGSPNKVIKDVHSPDGRYHVEVRECPAVGSLNGGVATQATVLEAQTQGICHSSVNTIAQFSVNSPSDLLQLEWMSSTELRAWHPSFNPAYGPEMFSPPSGNSPVKVRFSPPK